VALADPGKIQAIDELRIATRHQVEIAVAAKDDIESEIAAAREEVRGERAGRRQSAGD